MLISETYRQLNEDLHIRRDDYGKYGSKWAPAVFTLCAQQNTTDVLDYGCGKGTLNLHLPFSIQQYDPAVPKWSDTPEPADIVVCTDVMEHVEPDCLDDVLDDLQRLTVKVLLLNVATRPAAKTLADGRNAHLIVEQMPWWKEKIEKRFSVYMTDYNEGEFVCTCKPRD